MSLTQMKAVFKYTYLYLFTLEKMTMYKLPETGYLRLHQIIGNPKAVPPIPAIIPVSKSTWWNGVKTGRYPQPVRTLGLRITAWSVESIRSLIKQTGSGDDNV
jgi:prophage regulatory protein